MPRWMPSKYSSDDPSALRRLASTGYCPSAAMTNRASIAVKDGGLVDVSGSAIDARSAQSSVTSTSTQTVASGISVRLRDILVATARRSMLNGSLRTMPVPSVPPSPARSAVAGADAVAVARRCRRA